jgi:TetR/AcrR family transcriptional repressor of nem operon
MLATEYATLPREVQDEVRRFFAACEAWLAKVLSDGRRSRALAFEGSAAAAARTLFAALEGAMMSARAFGDPDRLAGAGRWLVDQVRR